MPTIPRRLPIVGDPLRRCHVPRDLGPVTSVGAEAAPEEGGLDERTVERIWDSAVGLYRSGVHPAVQLCVRRNGAVVVDRAVGHARGNGPFDRRETEKELVTTATPFVVYSAAKAVTAFVVHMLGERGLLSIDDPVSEHWPEYARHGKDRITIGQVLAHRSGVPNLPREAFDLANMDDPEYLAGVLCDAKPASRPGERLAYHAVSGGFILGELVRRVTGRTIREVLAAEILDPLGFRWSNYGVAEEDIGKVGISYVTGPRTLPPLSNLLTRALGVGFDRLVDQTNDSRFLTGIVPAANIVTNANELSRFYEIMRRGGELDGVRVMEPETIRRALTEQSFRELDFSLGFPTRFSYGLMLGAQVVSLLGPDTQMAFGHLGFTNIMGWADPERGVSCALVTSGKPVLYPELPRFYGVMQRIAREVPKVDPAEIAL